MKSSFEQLLQKELTIAQHNMIVASQNKQNINDNIMDFVKFKDMFEQLRGGKK